MPPPVHMLKVVHVASPQKHRNVIKHTALCRSNIILGYTLTRQQEEVTCAACLRRLHVLASIKQESICQSSTSE